MELNCIYLQSELHSDRLITSFAQHIVHYTSVYNFNDTILSHSELSQCIYLLFWHQLTILDSIIL